MRRFWHVCQETLNLFLTDVLSCSACVIIDNEKMCLSLRYSPICFLIKIPSALAFFYKCLHFLVFATGKYPSLRSDLYTPASHKCEVSRVLRSHEYSPVTLVPRFLACSFYIFRRL